MVDRVSSLHAGSARPRPLRRRQGSVLIATLFFLTIIATLALSVLDLALTTYRLSMRNQLRAQARAVAESELEFVFYKFKSVAVTGTAADKIAAALIDYCDEGDTPTTVHDPFLKTQRDTGWKVMRSIERVRGPEPGIIPNTTKTGLYTYFVARVEVIPPASNIFTDTAHVRVGRRIMNSNTSIFQYSVFFQGDLELNPGSDTIINGDIVANGSIYMGATSGHTLTINNKIRLLNGHYLNKDENGNTTYTNPDAPAPPVGISFVAPVGSDGSSITNTSHAQVEVMDEAENLLGGIDVTATAKTRPDLFAAAGAGLDPTTWTEEQLAEAENNVHRSLIVPPPDAAASTEYPNATASTADDSVISVRRAYNKAGILVTISGSTVSVKLTDTDGNTSDVTASMAGVIGSATNVYDQREGKNVAITNIDVSALKTKLDALVGSGTTTNGLLYVNLKNSTSSAPAAIRLINATDVPQNDGNGFSVATNGGLYVQGSYNTTQITDPDGTTRHVPSMLMADAITVLSTNWNDANASSGLTSRVANLSAAETAAGNTVQINAGLLTGNISSSTSNSSGGAQNLVRYLEDWSSKSVSFNGSLGRLFASTQMVGPYQGPASIYRQPNRVFDFDSALPTHRPPGGPESTAFSRGSFFTW